MAGESETIYSFAGDASELLAELRLVRDQLGVTSKSAQDAGAKIAGATGGAASSVKAAAQDLSKATTSLGASSFKNLGELSTSLGATAFEASAAGDGLMSLTEYAARLRAEQTTGATTTRAAAAATAAHGKEALGASKAVHEFGFQTAQSKRELLVLAHELSQGNYKRFGGSMLVLAEQTGAATLLFNPLTAALVVATVVAYTYYKAVHDGATEQQAFNDSLQLTNNYAGITETGLKGIATQLQAVASVNDTQGIGAVNDALQALVSTGRFTGEALGSAGLAVLNLQRLTGQETADVVKDFAKMGDGVAKWAAEHNKSYHYLTADQFIYIRSLEAQGRTQDAIIANNTALNTSLGEQRKNVGYVKAAWNDAATAARSFWQSVMDLGKDTTTAQALSAAQERLGNARAALNASIQRGDNEATIQRRRNLVAGLESAAETLREGNRAEETAAAEKSAADQRTQKEIEDMGAGHQAALGAIDKAGLARRQAIAEVGREQELQDITRGYAEFTLSAQQYVDRKYAIEQAALAAKRDQVNEEIAIESRRPVGTPDEADARTAKLMELDAKRILLKKEQLKLDEQLRMHELAPAPRDVSAFETPTASFRQLELAQTSAVEQGINARRTAGFAAASDLVRTSRDLGISLIQDERERGMAEIALDEENVRKRLDLAVMSASDRKAIEDDLAAYRVLKERELNEKLKPEYQKLLDSWQDTTRLMRESFDDFQLGALQAGEDFWIEFAKTGKLNIKSLADFALTELARMDFRQNIAPLFSQASASVAGFLGIGASGAASQAASEAGREATRFAEQAAQSTATAAADSAHTAAVTGDTAALTTFTSTGVVPSTTALTGLTAAAQQAAAALASMSASGAAGGFSAGSLSGLFGGSGSFIGSTSYGATDFLANPFAAAALKDGAAIGPQGIHPFAKGSAFTNSIVREPTLFKFAGGSKFGVMGEAGDEAVMPLRRGPGGALGVHAFGGAQQAQQVVVQPIINNYSQSKVETRTTKNGVGQQQLEVIINEVVAEGIDNGTGPVHRAIGRRFGLNSAAGAPIIGRPS